MRLFKIFNLEIGIADIIITGLVFYLFLKAFGIIDPPDIDLWRSTGITGALFLTFYWKIKYDLSNIRMEIHKDLGERVARLETDVSYIKTKLSA